jgi:hypothetical protein
MPRPVELTISFDDGTMSTIPCHILSDDVPMRTLDGQLLSHALTDQWLENGWQVFEDVDGVFAFPFAKIIGLKEIGDD